MQVLNYFTDHFIMSQSYLKFFILWVLLGVGNFVCAQNKEDLSSLQKIVIPEPKLAIVNITGISNMPTDKEYEQEAWFDYSDENFTFKKRILIKAQGATSLAFPKKSFAVTFCDEDWSGDKTVDLRIGNWVKQDAFHFKASWIDTFRGGLAVATAYKLYEDMVQDEPRFAERAGLIDFNSKALCHPDCFPCVVYLNNEFQGIFAWQLKKHRKNFDLDKNNQRQVLFGLTENCFFFNSDTIQWKAIELKNPKVLDIESEEVLQQLVDYGAELKVIIQHQDSALIRNEINKRFDVLSIIDFIIHGLITANNDGFVKNVHFFTHDGVKWFITPYDLDGTFGNNWLNQYQFPADWSYLHSTYDMKEYLRCEPYTWIMNYFFQELTDRYITMRYTGVLSEQNIVSHLIDWNERVGEYYVQEHEKWSDAPSHSEYIINTPWENVDDWTDFYNVAEYSDTVTYEKDDLSSYGFRVWKAKAETKGVRPYCQCGYTDTIERVASWLNRRLYLLDDYFGYDPMQMSFPQKLDFENKSMLNGKLIKNGTVYIRKNGKLYNISGIVVRDSF